MRTDLPVSELAPMFRPIETERLRLRALNVQDAPVVHAYRTHADVARFQRWGTGPLESIEADIHAMNARAIVTPGQWYQVGICLRTIGTLIGDCGFRVAEWDGSKVEIGVALEPTMQGKGYAAEALRAFMDYLFTSLRKQTVFGVVDAANVRSAALMLRVGMRKVGRHGEQQNADFEEVFEIAKEKH